MSKKGSLNLSINAVVVIVLAITMLGLGLAFIRGMFGEGLDTLKKQFGELEEQRVQSLLENCDNEICLEKSTIQVQRTGEEKALFAVFNKFDCDLVDSSTSSSVQIYVGAKEVDNLGGSSKFAPTECRIIGDEGTCDDISIETFKQLDVENKQKEGVLMILKVKSDAKTTIYSYDIYLDGNCQYGTPLENFDLETRKTLNIEVTG